MMQANLRDVNSWDPLKYETEQPSRECLLRIQKDIAEFHANPPEGVFISPEDRNVTSMHVLIVGATGTPYEGGFFQFLLRFPPDYPASPPRMRHVTTDAGRVRFNASLYNNGKVCVSALGTAHGPGWSPSQSLSSVLVAVQALMGRHPYFNGHYRQEKSNESDMYDLFVRHETLRVAVCNQVEAALEDDPHCPPPFRKLILDSFLESYVKYEDAIKDQLHMTGTEMKDTYSPSLVATFQFETLLTRLQYLKHEVVNKLQENASEAAAPAAAEVAAQAPALTTAQDTALTTAPAQAQAPGQDVAQAVAQAQHLGHLAARLGNAERASIRIKSNMSLSRRLG
ncbi:hypothetical protein V5799_033274 [Amblyomma americanum]|uniref:Ubiquitin-conjugating enzyme E2 Z n=1 Tax=Amblyomma americanum TaxID=6943 RepID=A0AAQ4DNS7_AMBAM